jgi:alkanesulfonate monooxygenase SsuD/methylene tetrahydromethanopterin reductase-like flavin-dependent oxidoreductase (luciferase family)
MGSARAQYGISLPNRGVLIGAVTSEELLQVAVDAEATGFFESVWVGDSLMHKPRLESIVTLAAIAARTTRVRLGTCCMATFPIRHPIWIAAQWASLDVISGGRAVLGACIGGGVSRELAPFGVTEAERVGRMREGVEIIRRLWAEERVTYRGTYYTLEDVSVEPHPVQQPCPIWIASNPKAPLAESPVVERAMKRIGLLGDGYMTDSITPEEFRARWTLIQDAARTAGRTINESSLHLMVNIDDDPAKAKDEAREFLKRYYFMDLPESRVEMWLAYGTPEMVAAKIRSYIDVGCTLSILRFASFSQRAQLRQFMAWVAPHLPSR